MFRRRIGFALLVLSAVAVLPGMNCGPTAPTPQNIEIIIDNQDPGFIVVTGTWDTAATTDGNGCYGPDFRYHLADRIAVGVASFTPLVAQAGSYSVYIYWSADPNRTTSQPVIDEAHVPVSSQSHTCEIQHLIVIDPPHDHHVQLHGL